MNVHKQKFPLQIGSSKIEEESSKSEINSGVIVCVKVVYEFAIIFNFKLTLFITISALSFWR